MRTVAQAYNEMRESARPAGLKGRRYKDHGKKGGFETRPYGTEEVSGVPAEVDA